MYKFRLTEGVSIEIAARDKHRQIYSKTSRYFLIITVRACIKMHMKDVTRCNDATRI